MRKREIYLFDKKFTALIAEAQSGVFEQARQYIRFGPMEVYTRVGKRYVPLRMGRRYITDGAFEWCVQLASFSIPIEHQRKGYFTELLKRVCELTELPIYIDAVLIEDFGKALERRGFIKVRETEYGWQQEYILFPENRR